MNQTKGSGSTKKFKKIPKEQKSRCLGSLNHNSSVVRIDPPLEDTSFPSDETIWWWTIIIWLTVSLLLWNWHHDAHSQTGVTQADFPDSIVLHQQTIWVEILIRVGSTFDMKENEQCWHNGLPPLAKLHRVLIDEALVLGLDPDFGDPFWHTIRAWVVARGQRLVDQLGSRNYCHLLYKTA